MTVAPGILPFKIVLVKSCADVTSRAGLPLVLEALRVAVGTQAPYKALARTLGYDDYNVVLRHVESLVLLIASGGECLDDLAMLRGDSGLVRLLGFLPSSPTQAKDFLYRFHQAEDGRPLGDADDDRLSVAGTATLRPDGPALRALADWMAPLVEGVQDHRPAARVTLDVDATIVEASKQRALRTYEGMRGYQPQMAWWAEQEVWVLDEFRDGNVPAAMGISAFLKRAFAQAPRHLPRFLRADSALYDEKGLTWLDEQGIQFAVSADMSTALQEKVRALLPQEWRPYRPHAKDDTDAAEEREWAEVPEFIPGWARNVKNGTVPFRYVAIRVRSRQRDLLESDEARWRYFAVVTNRHALPGDQLLRWHRLKQGTVEQGHRSLKNELAGGTLPCGRFGANAAWWRFNAATHNLLQFLKVTALPHAMAAHRPKALRFRLFDLPGRVVSHGRALYLHIACLLPTAQLFTAARNALHALWPRTGSPPPAPA